MSQVAPISDDTILETAQRRVAPVVAWLLEERLNIGQSAALVGRFTLKGIADEQAAYTLED